MEQTTKLRERFEANMLDGESIDDCGGTMLSAKEVYEFFAQEFDSILSEKREALKAMKKHTHINYKGFEKPHKNYVMNTGYNKAIEDALSVLDES